MKAKFVIDREFQIAPLSRRLFGAFVEHLGRCVYGGIYEPSHPTADARGFRRDVLALVRELGVTIVRYPGGNFVSGFRWEDSVGPKEKRPVRRELAWMSIETNQFGLNEFIEWCTEAGVEPMMAVNLGTRGPVEAGELFEYCNHPSGTTLSELRKTHGYEKPHDIRLWCLGNEMDGFWQMGQKSAREYGRAVRESVKLMRWPDKNRSSTVFPEYEFIACGSSGVGMPSFRQWEADVLEEAFDYVQYISLHSYYSNHHGDIADFLSCSEQMSAFIKQVSAAWDFIAAKKKSKKKIMLSFDEWNVWYHSFKDECTYPAWSIAPPLLEDVYNMSDALAVGGMLIALMNNAERVKIACLAQLVNVIAPIMTRNGGPAWRQTIFHPFAQASRQAKGNVLLYSSDCPSYDCTNCKNVPYVIMSPVFDEKSKSLSVFLLNRNLNESATIELDLRGFPEFNSLKLSILHNEDLSASNTEKNPERVKPVFCNSVEISRNLVNLTVPPASWSVLKCM